MKDGGWKRIRRGSSWKRGRGEVTRTTAFRFQEWTAGLQPARPPQLHHKAREMGQEEDAYDAVEQGGHRRGRVKCSRPGVNVG